MAYRLIYISVCLIFTACSQPQPPEFKKFSKLEVRKITFDSIYFSGIADLYNPNGFGGKVEDIHMDVTIEDKPACTIMNRSTVTVGSKEIVKVPVYFSIPMSNLIKLSGGILGGMLNNFGNKELDIGFDGVIYVRLAGIKIKVPVKEKTKVNIDKGIKIK